MDNPDIKNEDLAFVKKDHYFRVDITLNSKEKRKDVSKALKKNFKDLPLKIAWTEKGAAFKATGVFTQTKGGKEKQVKSGPQKKK